MFVGFVMPLLATILCIIMGNLVPTYTCSTYFPVGQTKTKMAEKKRVTTPILKPTGDQKRETPLGSNVTYVYKLYVKL